MQTETSTRVTQLKRLAAKHATPSARSSIKDKFGSRTVVVHADKTNFGTVYSFTLDGTPIKERHLIARLENEQ